MLYNAYSTYSTVHNGFSGSLLNLAFIYCNFKVTLSSVSVSTHNHKLHANAKIKSYTRKSFAE